MSNTSVPASFGSNDSTNPGECPECGEVIQYNGMEIEDNNLYRECECLGCGWTGKEWYQLQYIETINENHEPENDVYDDDNEQVFKW